MKKIRGLFYCKIHKIEKKVLGGDRSVVSRNNVRTFDRGTRSLMVPNF